MCPCGCGASEEKLCWKKSEWTNICTACNKFCTVTEWCNSVCCAADTTLYSCRCEFCQEPSNDGVCEKCDKAITKFEEDMKNERN